MRKNFGPPTHECHQRDRHARGVMADTMMGVRELSYREIRAKTHQNPCVGCGGGRGFLPKTPNLNPYVGGVVRMFIVKSGFVVFRIGYKYISKYILLSKIFEYILLYGFYFRLGIFLTSKID